LILVDTSVWLFDRRRFQLREVVPMDEVAVCGPIIQEVLQGMGEIVIQSNQYQETRTTLLACHILANPLPLQYFEYAAEIYRTARLHGYTPRSPNDCLIATVAILQHVPLLHADRDFDFIAEIANLDARRLKFT